MSSFRAECPASLVVREVRFVHPGCCCGASGHVIKESLLDVTYSHALAHVVIPSGVSRIFGCARSAGFGPAFLLFRGIEDLASQKPRLVLGGSVGLQPHEKHHPKKTGFSPGHSARRWQRLKRINEHCHDATSHEKEAVTGNR
jgi:hypothetical protein